MLSLQGVANLLHAYAIRGIDFEVVMDLARGRPMDQIAQQWGMNQHQMRLMRNGLFSHYPILEQEIRSRLKRVPTKIETRAALARDRRLLQELLEKLILDRNIPTWSREVVASLGLEMLDYMDLPGESEHDIVNGLYGIYGFTNWISHRRCHACKLMRYHWDYPEEAKWRQGCERCRQCLASKRRKERSKK
jgi:hypothetical protein